MKEAAMKTFRVHVHRDGFYEVKAKDRSEAYEVLNALPEPTFHLTEETVESIVEVKSDRVEEAKP